MPGKEAETRRIVGQQMLKARESMGLDQAEAARRVGITTAQWGSYERGERSPGLAMLRAFPIAFHRSLSWLFNLRDERGLDPPEQEVISLERAIKDPNLRQAALETAARQLQAQVSFYQQEAERPR